MTGQDIRNLIRSRLLKNISDDKNRFQFTNLEDLKNSQWCDKFIELMRNRMLLGAFRYGLLSSQKYSGIKYNNLSSIKKRLILYEQTGNTEFLVDCSNLCMIEYLIGDHPNKHFKAIDDGCHHAELKR